MNAARKNRPSVPRPDPGDQLATVHFLFLRADYLRELWTGLSKDAADAGDGIPDVSLKGGYGIPLWTCTTMHLAALYTVVEGWNRVKASASRVDRLLEHAANVQALRNLRDGVFHFGAINNPAIMQILADRAMLTWAKQLHQAFADFMANRDDSDGAA